MYGAGFLVDGEEPGFEEILLNGGSLYDYYETKDGRFISFGGLEPQFFKNFCETIGRPDFIPGGVLPENIEDVKQEVREIILTKTMDEWMVLFNATDACVEPVMTLSEVFEDSLVKERGMVVELPLPGGGVAKQLANPIKFSEAKPVYKNIGSTLASGTQTKEVFRELGYTDSEIDEFEKTGLFS
jgi:alpha-methylacyl-CoA racemase